MPVHVIAFAEDVQAPLQNGEELARLIPGGKLHLLDGMGHGSWYGHARNRRRHAVRVDAAGKVECALGHPASVCILRSFGEMAPRTGW